MAHSTLPGPLLGTTAKSISAPGPKAFRALRYQALSQARFILRRAARAILPKAYPGDVFRTADCRHVPRGLVEVHYSTRHEAAHYGNLVTCGSVWACPVCAAKIQERRRLEIEQAIVWAQAQGLGVLLVTFTFPHRAFQTLAELLTAQADAFQRLRSSRAWARLKASIDFRGLIRSLECTHGLNGWHPHTHELWFVNRSMGTALQARLWPLWEKACIKAGLLDPADEERVAAFRLRSVDVRADVTVGDYLAKQDDSRTWGFAHEVAKATSKAGRLKGVYPHHFLVRGAAGDDRLFLEYVQGMKGRRQLFWSHGLKRTVGIGEVTDETLAEEQRDPAELLGVLLPAEWRLIAGNDAHAEVLDAAETGGWPAVQALLASLA